MKIYRTTFTTILLVLLATACDTSAGGYHYTPREYFRDNPEAVSNDDCRTGRIFRHSVIHTRPAPVEPSCIPDKVVRASLSQYSRSNLSAMARAKKQVKAKEPVRLRMKPLSNGNKSLYLDIYHNGKRTYEYLKLYLIPDAGDAIAQHQNAITMMAANARKSRRIIEITSSESGIFVPELKEKIFLVDWMQTYLESQQKRGRKDIAQIRVALRIVKEYAGENTLLDEVDKTFCKGFLEYLQVEYRPKGRRVTDGTLHNYYRCVNSALNAAVRAEHIKVNPFNLLDPSDKIHKPESKREYLTIDEVRTLIATPIKSRSEFNASIKSAYLFSCFCGLRISDAMAITGITYGRGYLIGQLHTLPTSPENAHQFPLPPFPHFAQSFATRSRWTSDKISNKFARLCHTSEVIISYIAAHSACRLSGVAPEVVRLPGD